MEAKGEEYTFEPLRTTLINMQLLTGHILEGQQFWSPLSGQEATVLEWLRQDIDSLLSEPEIPYKRTLLLSYKFTLLYDWMVNHKVYAHLKQDESSPEELSETSALYTTDFKGITLMKLYQVFQGDTLEELLQNFETVSSGCHRLVFLDHIENFFSALGTAEAILYPGYEPLDIEHFNRFGHLPFYPLGMVANFGTWTDGRIFSPMRFYGHDIHHLVTQGTYKRVSQSGTLCSPENRYDFRKLILSHIPENMPETMTEAVELLIFELYHEGIFEWTLDRFKADSYTSIIIPILNIVKQYAPLSDKYQRVTVEAATLAAFWVHGLKCVWNDNNQQPLSDEDIKKFVIDTFKPAIPKILSELQWIKQNKGKLLTIIPNYFPSKCDGLKGTWVDLIEDDADENQGRPAYFQIEPVHLFLLDNNEQYKEEIGALRR